MRAERALTAAAVAWYLVALGDDGPIVLGLVAALGAYSFSSLFGGGGSGDA